MASVAAAGLAILAIGCGDDESEDSGEEASSESVEQVTLIADDRDGYSFELSDTPTTETKSVVFDNQGEEGHFLVFARLNEGYTLEEVIELEGEKGSAEVYVEKGAGPGQTKTFELSKSLQPGDYAMLCPIPSKEGPHFELGQLEEFSIE
jgi:hypothetical protein